MINLGIISSPIAEDRLKKLYDLYKKEKEKIDVLEALINHFKNNEYNDKNIEMVKQKMRHMLEVPIVARRIAIEENITDKNLIKLIDIAALLHDWGRLYDILEGSFSKNLGHPKNGVIDLFDNKKIYEFLPTLSDNEKNILYYAILLHGVESMEKETNKDKKLLEITKKERSAKLVCTIIRNADKWANNVDFLIEDYKVIVGATSLNEIWNNCIDKTTKEELLNGKCINRGIEGVPYTRLRQLASHIGWAFAEDNLPSYKKWLYETKWPLKYALFHVPNDPNEISENSHKTIAEFIEITNNILEQLKTETK